MLGPHQEVSYGPATANPSNGTSVSALNLDAGPDGDWPGPRRRTETEKHGITQKVERQNGFSKAVNKKQHNLGFAPSPA